MAAVFNSSSMTPLEIINFSLGEHHFPIQKEFIQFLENSFRTAPEVCKAELEKFYQSATLIEQEKFFSQLSAELLAFATDFIPEDVLTLSFNNVEELTPDLLLKILQKSKHLQVLHLSSGLKISDETLKAIAQACPQLKKLDISFSGDQITDKGIEFLAQSCPNLESLDVSGCTKLTDAAVVAIKIHCLKFPLISYEGCPLISGREKIPLVYGYICRQKRLGSLSEKSVALTVAALSLVPRNQAGGVAEKIATRILAGVGIVLALVINSVELIARFVLGMLVVPFNRSKGLFLLKTVLLAAVNYVTLFQLFAKNIYKTQAITTGDLEPFCNRN